MILTSNCPSCRCPVTTTLPDSTPEADAQSLAGRILCVECAQTPRPAPLPPGRTEMRPALLTLAAILNAATGTHGALAGPADASGDLAH